MARATAGVAVLGATGFIGGHIARQALEQGWLVRGLRRNAQATGHLGDAAIQWHTGDLSDPIALRQLMDGVQAVFHAAAYYPTASDRRPIPEKIAYALREIEGVLAAARRSGVARFIYTSTLTTIGLPPPGEDRLADERDYYQPGALAGSAYYEAKFAMEAAALRAADQGLPVVVLCPTATFGPGDVHLTMGRILLAFARGWGRFWLPGTMNVVDVRDVAAAHLAAAERGGLGERYIIGGHNLTIQQAISQIAAQAGCPPPWFGLPARLLDALVALDKALPGWNLTGNHLRGYRYWQAYNTEKARRELGFTPRPFAETVRDALDWFQAHGYR